MKNGIGNNWFKNKGFYATNEYLKYQGNKELSSFKNPHVAISFNMALYMQEEYRNRIKEGLQKHKMRYENQKNSNIERRRKVTYKDGKVVSRETIYVDKDTGKEL